MKAVLRKTSGTPGLYTWTADYALDHGLKLPIATITECITVATLIHWMTINEIFNNTDIATFL